MELVIKNMVCRRCIKTVNSIAEKLKLPVTDIELGKMVLANDPGAAILETFRREIEQEGFELLDDQKQVLIANIRQLIINLVQSGDLTDKKYNLSTYLSEVLHKDYNYLSNLFSAVENTTIEQYFILQKLERVKEWLAYNELSLAEIAFQLGYSSTAHLSAQFKKVTGFTPTQFKALKQHHRKPFDEI